MMIWGMLLLAAFIMKLWPQTGLAEWLNEVLIRRPLALFSKIKRQHLIFLVVGFGVMYSFAMAGMPHLGVAAAIDVSAFVDAAITVSMIAAYSRTRAAWTAVLARLPRLRRPANSQRRKRSAVRPARKPAANDDDRHGAPGNWALVA